MNYRHYAHRHKITIQSLLTARFNIQEFYMVVTLPFCILYGSQEKSATFFLYNIQRMDFKSEAESVYSAVRTESLYNTDTFRLQKVDKVIYFLRTSILLEFSKLRIYFNTEIRVYFKKFTQLYFMFGVRARDRSVRNLIRNLQQTFLTQSMRMYVYIRSCNKAHQKHITAPLKTKI